VGDLERTPQVVAGDRGELVETLVLALEFRFALLDPFDPTAKRVEETDARDAQGDPLEDEPEGEGLGNEVEQHRRRHRDAEQRTADETSAR